MILLYTQLPLSNEVLWLLGFPLGFFASGYFSGIGAFLTELYPTRLRGSGQGFCYNFGRGIGALFPFLVGALSNSTSLGNAIAIFAVLAYGYSSSPPCASGNPRPDVACGCVDSVFPRTPRSRAPQGNEPNCCDNGSSMTSLKGKTLFVTGASRGIGLAIALRAARDGANVAIAAKTAEPHPSSRAPSTPPPRRSEPPAARRCR